MTLTLTYEQWLQGTGLNVFKPRNSALKAVDQAILQYQQSRSENDLWRVRNVFEDWKRSEGPMWRSSERNRKQAITLLDRDLFKLTDARTYQLTHMRITELMALAEVAKSRKKVLESLFAKKQVTLKAAKLPGQLAKAGAKVTGCCQQAEAWLSSNKKSGRPAGDMAREKMIAMATTFFGVTGLEQLGTLGGVILEILGKCALSVPPVVGHIKDGYDLFTGWAKAGSSLYTQHNISDRSYTIDTGVPSNAFAGLKKCLEAETRNEAVSATNATSSFALKTGLAFVDGGVISGPVVGAVSAMAEFAHTLYLLAMEYRATQAINRCLSEGTLDVRLFKTYPLMGCYLLVSATLSDLIPIDSFGTPGWMDYIENTHQQVFAGIYGAASGLIEKSPWEIIGLPKRAAGTACGVFPEAQRIFATLNPLVGLANLRTLA